MTDELRNTIIEETGRMSYGVIAERYGLTRGQVAGIVWRHRNPGKRRNGNGRGLGTQGIMPAYTLQNTR